MGALTAKKKHFQQRPWESRSFVEIDDSEILPFRIRVENLKNQRIRVLPIKYWIADKKRYQSEKNFSNISIFLFKLYSTYNLLNQNFCEKLNIKYLVGGIQIIKKITKYMVQKKLNILLSNVINHKISLILTNNDSFSYFLPNARPSSPTLKAQNLNFLGYTKIPLDKSNSFILTCNPRLFSPTFTIFLFQNQDALKITSLGGHSINLFHEELPLSNYTINKILNGQNEEQIVKFVINQDDTRFTNLDAEIIQLSPIFLQSNQNHYNRIHKNTKTYINLNLSLSTKKFMIEKPFLSTLPDVGQRLISNINIPSHDEFDKFLLMGIYQKFLQRILVIFPLLERKYQTSALSEIIIYTKKKKQYIIN